MSSVEEKEVKVKAVNIIISVIPFGLGSRQRPGLVWWVSTPADLQISLMQAARMVLWDHKRRELKGVRLFHGDPHRT